MTIRARAVLFTGIGLAVCVEALAGTAMNVARADMLGDIYATPDAFARLDIAYIGAKLTGFLLAPWLMGRITPRAALIVATALIMIACGAMAPLRELEPLIVLRGVQGLAGGVLLVAGQSLLFHLYAPRVQPGVQAVFIAFSAVTPAMLTPFLHGWVVDNLAWPAAFAGMAGLALPALALQVASPAGSGLAGPGDTAPGSPRQGDRRTGTRFDLPGLAFLMIFAFALVFLLEQGRRWNWFDATVIAMAGLVAGIAFLLLSIRQITAPPDRRLIDLSVFANPGFCFGFLASFVAGFGLAGSGFLISAFSISALGMSATLSGLLVLPGTLAFLTGLAITVLLVQRAGRPPIMTVPLGVLGLMAALWLLAQSGDASGMDSLMPALLLRGLSFGFLILSLTLITITGLRGRAVAQGIGLFNVGRQLGGVIAVALLGTVFDRLFAINRTALAAHIQPGDPGLSESSARVARALATRGLDPAMAEGAAHRVLGGELAHQSALIAFNNAFLAVALFFLAAAPVLIGAKLVIGKTLGRRA